MKMMCKVCGHEIFEGRKFKRHGNGYSHQECKIDFELPTADTFTADLSDIKELIEQARIGRAVQKAFEEGYMIGKDEEYWFGDGECCKTEIETIATTELELLEWAEQEEKK